MKFSTLEFYVIAVNGGIRGIYNGKLSDYFRVKQLHSYNDFCQLDKKAFDGIEQYSKQLISNCSTLDGQFPPANTPDSQV